MPKKKKEEIEETTAETAVEETETEATEEVKADAAETEEKAEESTSIVDTVTNAVASAVETVAETASAVVSTVAKAVSGNSEEAKTDRGNRAERVGVVSSDKMEKTVTVRVDRLVKHPMYRKYIKRRKKFMAHDELGATIGDKVRIVETRPLSAKKRWRVVEIIQKAEK